MDGLVEVLRRIEQGAIRCLAVDTPSPSPFCHEILNANPYAFLDDAPLEERRARTVAMRRTLPPDLAGRLGALDEAAIYEVPEGAWPLAQLPRPVVSEGALWPGLCSGRLRYVDPSDAGKRTRVTNLLEDCP